MPKVEIGDIWVYLPEGKFYTVQSADCFRRAYSTVGLDGLRTKEMSLVDIKGGKWVKVSGSLSLEECRKLERIQELSIPTRYERPSVI